MTNTIAYTGLFSLSANPMERKHSGRVILLVFFLLFSISLAHASQNYKVLVGEMHKA